MKNYFSHNIYRQLFGLLFAIFTPFVMAMRFNAAGDEEQGGGLTAEDVKKAVKAEVESLTKSLSLFTKKEDMEREVKAVTDKIEELNIKGLTDEIATLRKSSEEQGIELKKRFEKDDAKPKTLLTLVRENADKIMKLADDKNGRVVIKVVTASGNFTDYTNYTRADGVGQIPRGYPFMRDLFNVVVLGPNSSGSVAYVEQNAITSNVSQVAEANASSSASNITWVEKTISGKRIHDWIPISKNQIKDVDFVAGECQRLINMNIRLQENSQLLVGDGQTNNIKGIVEYAQPFSKEGITIRRANLNDLIGKVKTQIRTGSMDKFMANIYVANPADIDNVRFDKDELGQYIFPMWAQGLPVNMAGLRAVENSLMTEDTLLVGDFNLGTIYVWDELTVEIGFINDDFTKGLVTLSGYLRENLLVRDNDVQGFVYIPDVTTTINDITLE